MKILLTEEQFNKLLNEDILGVINRDDITFNDLWYGFDTFKHGFMQSKKDSPLIQIQQKLYDKFPEYADEIKFKPDLQLKHSDPKRFHTSAKPKLKLIALIPQVFSNFFL